MNFINRYLYPTNMQFCVGWIGSALSMLIIYAFGLGGSIWITVPASLILFAAFNWLSNWFAEKYKIWISTK